MNLKEKIKRFWILNVHNHEGFTLVELIIVIAILAILSSVAVVGYSSYITKANKQADMTLASEVANALTLYYYSQSDFSGVSTVVLTADGAVVADGDTFAAAAMQAAFGDNWRTTAALKYNKWGNGAAIAKNVVAHFVSATGSLSDIYNGTLKPSFAADVEELYQEVEDTAIYWGNYKQLGTGAELMQGVAAATLGFTSDDPNKTNEDAFADAWASCKPWAEVGLSLTGENTTYNAGANYAVIKARNASLGTYLKTLGYSNEFANALMNYGGSDGLPVDVMGDGVIGNFLGEYYALLPADKDFGGVIADFASYGSSGQARIDGLAYYAVMDTVSTAGSSATSDDTYWDDMSGAVSIYAAIAAGEVDLDEINALYDSLNFADNSIAITLMITDGAPKIQISPNSADSSK